MEERSILKPTEARQGVIGHNVRYVVIVSIVLVVVAFFVVALFTA